MAISFKRYVDITSGVGGGAGVRLRDLIGRLFSTNSLIPTESMIEFTELADVGTYFGTTSEEYLRASFYFGWISKNITKAKKISFARWADADTKPQIYGKVGAQVLASWTAISAGNMSLTIGADTNIVGPLSFSGAATLAGVAGIIQAKIRTFTGTNWTSATVTWNATRQSFDFEGGAAGAAAISVAAGATNDYSALLGWRDPQTIVSDGVDAETVTETLTASADASDNFGSFLFMKALSAAEVLEAAVWNDAQNNKFFFCQKVLPVDAATTSAALIGYSGWAGTISDVSGQYPEQVPMMILAATDYTKRNSTQNYMFQQFTLTPSVTTTALANVYDPLRLNYYGRTQTAGQFIEFYQRGVLGGGSQDATDQNTYANEMWLKDAAGAAIMELLLSLSKVSANSAGRSQLLATLQSVIDRALFNGTISVGKTLNNTQKQYIGVTTGDPDAWHQVENSGYWIDCVLQSYVTTDSRTEWKAVYTLIYGKDDAIRKVEGSHVMI
jgi:hypothetical protein